MITLRAGTLFGSADHDVPDHIRLRVERIFGPLLDGRDAEVAKDARKHNADRKESLTHD